jgi:hypothetical protein
MTDNSKGDLARYASEIAKSSNPKHQKAVVKRISISQTQVKKLENKFIKGKKKSSIKLEIPDN